MKRINHGSFSHTGEQDVHCDPCKRGIGKLEVDLEPMPQAREPLTEAKMVTDLEVEVNSLHHEAEGLTADILEQRERNAQLEQALRKYGRHRETCGRWLCWHTHHVPECCTCGFEVYVGTKSE